jgi:hypothetical protein
VIRVGFAQNEDGEDEAWALGSSQHDIVRWQRLIGRHIGGGIVCSSHANDKVTGTALNSYVHGHTGGLGRA